MIPGRIIEVYNEASNRMGLVEFDGKRRAIYLSLVPDAKVGDMVRFHAGFATGRVNVEEAENAGEVFGRAPKHETPARRMETDRAFRVLCELEPRQLRMLIPLADDKHFATGDIIFSSGEKSLFLHLIVSGDVALEAVSDRHTVGVQTLRAGDAMGWSALTSDGITHFQARALTPVATIAFAGDSLRAACERDPAMGYALMKRLMELATERLDAMRLRLVEKSKTAAANG
jgi:CRP-like cAMP-binding protein